MFLLTQFVGLYVVNHYSSVKIIDGEKVIVDSPKLPYGLDNPQVEKEIDFLKMLPSIILSFVMAILILLFLTRTRSDIVMKIWFFIVVTLALSITFNSFIPAFKFSTILALAIALPLSLLKIFKRHFLIHNSTEIFIYPGIAAIFVSILNIWTVVIILLLISFYDMWAVWHTGFMQKMAKYQIKKLKIFSGFFIPYMTKQIRDKIKKLSPAQLKKKKIQVHVAILGGGDVVFPIIASGVILKTLGLIPALLVILGATIGLSILLFLAEKKKFYPAMPFITFGIFIGIILGYLII